MRTSITVLMAALLAPVWLHARVGETQEQSEKRYGSGQEVRDEQALILKHAPNLIFHHGDWVITAAYLNGITVRIQYERTSPQQPRAQLMREDVSEILEAEDPRGWTAYNERSEKSGKPYDGKTHPPPALRSASGLTARYQVFKVTVERQEASLHEKGILPQQAPIFPRTRSRVAL